LGHGHQGVCPASLLCRGSAEIRCGGRGEASVRCICPSRRKPKEVAAPPEGGELGIYSIGLTEWPPQQTGLVAQQGVHPTAVLRGSPHGVHGGQSPSATLLPQGVPGTGRDALHQTLYHRQLVGGHLQVVLPGCGGGMRQGLLGRLAASGYSR